MFLQFIMKILFYYLFNYVKYLIYKNIDNEYSIAYSKSCYKYIQMKYLGYLLPERRSDLSDEEFKIYRTPYGDFYESWDYIITKTAEHRGTKVHLLIRIAVLLEYYNKTSNSTPKYKYLKIIIFTGYLICWLYVLIISYPNISMEEWNRLIMFLNKYKNILDQIW